MKALSGVYYVQTPDALIECKARGRFRKQGVTPMVGDLARVSMENGKGMLEEILPRKNCFIRPAIANIDVLVSHRPCACHRRQTERTCGAVRQQRRRRARRTACAHL